MCLMLCPADFLHDSPLRVCPIHFFCLVFIERMRDLSSPIVSNIFSFVLCSVQLTFSILLQVHISKASSLFYIFFPHFPCFCSIYSTTHHISVFIIVSSMFCLLFLSKVLSFLRMLLFLL